jgi:hypothetical protein
MNSLNRKKASQKVALIGALVDFDKKKSKA